MNNLTIKQFCQLETLKSDLNPLVESGCQYHETTEDNLTILELTNSAGEVIQEVIVVF